MPIKPDHRSLERPERTQDIVVDVVAAASEPTAEAPSTPLRTFPLGMVLQACPDIADYARHGISSRQDFLTAAGVVRTALGISPSAWTEACQAMGEEAAAVTVAAILQK